METPKISIRVINHFERDLGKLSPEQEEAVTLVLRTFMDELRGLEAIQCAEGMCKTCAFNPEADDEKFAGTTWGLLRAMLMRGNRFACHANQPGWKEKGHSKTLDLETLRDCAGFWAIMKLGDMEEMKRAVMAAAIAFLEIEAMVPTVPDLLVAIREPVGKTAEP